MYEGIGLLFASMDDYLIAIVGMAEQMCLSVSKVASGKMEYFHNSIFCKNSIYC